MPPMVLWTSRDRSVATRDTAPEHEPVARRHCHHCRPSPRRPSCAPCCPHSASPVPGVSMCATPPSSPRVTYTRLPPSPRATYTALPLSPRATTHDPSPRATSPTPLALPERGHHEISNPREWNGPFGEPVTLVMPPKMSTEGAGVSLSRQNGGITITVSVASAVAVRASPCPRPVAPSPGARERASLKRGCHEKDLPTPHACETENRPPSSTQFRCRRGLLDERVSALDDVASEPGVGVMKAAALPPCVAGG